MYGLFTPEIIEQLKKLSNFEPTGIISASTNFSEGRMEETGELDHYTCCRKAPSFSYGDIRQM